MDENLLGYLLNALDDDAQRQVEEELRTQPEARAKLERLRLALAPLAAAEPSLPPPSLFVDTLARIAEFKCRPLPPAPQHKPRETGSSGWRVPRRSDALVAAALLLVALGLLTTWIVRVRQHEQIVYCQNNMHLWWLALSSFSDMPENGRGFPRVEAEGPLSVAGVFVPLLHDAQLVTSEMSAGCPGVSRQPPPSLGRAQLEAMYQSDPAGFQRTASTLAGDYAYSLGYKEKDVLCGLFNDSGDRLPLLADQPPGGLTGASPNHGGRGQNVLYIGGHVRWCTERTVGVDLDDIYLNKKGQLLTGEDRVDTVLGPSEATPYRQQSRDR